LLNQAINAVNCHFMQKIKSKVGLLVGQHAATRLDGSKNWNVYDLIISSFPPTVDWFRERGVRAELHRLGFEPQNYLHCEMKAKNMMYPLLAVSCGAFIRIG